MRADDLTQTLQKGFRVALGATASLIESLQDSQKRDENLAKLRLEWNELSDELATKGELTEQEARNFMDAILTRSSPSSGTSSSSSSTATTTAPKASPDIQLELQELTTQIAAMRAELEKLREQDAKG
jgi:polyhydroxyalkanoate synthesis regulator phasin